MAAAAAAATCCSTPAPLGLDDILAAVGRLLADPHRPVAIVVLFGAPGRGKTTLATHVGRAQRRFTEINGSCERRGPELRDALSRFVSDGNQAAVAAAHGAAGASGALSRSHPAAPVLAAAAGAAPPCCALLVDEADGLGAVGQATVASFVEELEDGARGHGSARPLRMGDWRALILLTCNTLGRIHDAILSRAHVLAEVPRPSAAALVAAALSWGAALDAARLEELAKMADGDFRAMRQLTELEMCGSSGALAAPITPAVRELIGALQVEEGQRGTAAALGAFERTWREGLRADDLQHWVTWALVQHSVTPTRRARLLRFKRSLQAMQQHRGPQTLLQVVGAFARDVYFGGEEGRAAAYGRTERGNSAE